ncbi:MAG: SDR family oxidoreductase [Gammaproteobacteria bacterium]|nr:SDR family oxidoreductase [Gammaproteobacteria bacterium]
MQSLDGKTAIVTGAGRGIGRAIALGLAAERAHLVLTARTRSEIDDVASTANELGSQAIAIPGDAAHEDTASTVVGAAMDEFGPVDILVNNAGFAIRSPTYKTKVDDWDRVIAVNLRGPFLFARAVAEQMAKRGSGVIVGISSAAGLRGAPVHSMGAYAASKFGLVGFNESLAESLREFGVRVFTVCPGPVNDAGASARKSPPPRPNPRSITSADVANTVMFAIKSLPLASSGRVIDLYQPTF